MLEFFGFCAFAGWTAFFYKQWQYTHKVKEIDEARLALQGDKLKLEENNATLLAQLCDRHGVDLPWRGAGDGRLSNRTLSSNSR
jgi:hypothetical protein